MPTESSHIRKALDPEVTAGLQVPPQD